MSNALTTRGCAHCVAEHCLCCAEPRWAQGAPVQLQRWGLIKECTAVRSVHAVRASIWYSRADILNCHGTHLMAGFALPSLVHWWTRLNRCSWALSLDPGTLPSIGLEGGNKALHCLVVQAGRCMLGPYVRCYALPCTKPSSTRCSIGVRLGCDSLALVQSSAELAKECNALDL